MPSTRVRAFAPVKAGVGVRSLCQGTATRPFLEAACVITPTTYLLDGAVALHRRFSRKVRGISTPRALMLLSLRSVSMLRSGKALARPRISLVPLRPRVPKGASCAKEAVEVSTFRSRCPLRGSCGRRSTLVFVSRGARTSVGIRGAAFTLAGLAAGRTCGTSGGAGVSARSFSGPPRMAVVEPRNAYVKKAGTPCRTARDVVVVLEGQAVAQVTEA